MNITVAMARKRIAKSQPVYAEYYNGQQRRERVLRIVDHDDEVTIDFFHGRLRMAKNRIQFIA